MVRARPPRFRGVMRIDELNALEDERARRVFDVAAVALAIPVGLAFGFASFGSALAANIYVDGHDGATFAEVLGSIAPMMTVLAAPAIALAAVAARRRLHVVRWVIALAALQPMWLLGLYALGAIAAGAGASSAWRSARDRTGRLPAVDASVLVAGVGLMVLWCALEAAR